MGKGIFFGVLAMAAVAYFDSYDELTPIRVNPFSQDIAQTKRELSKLPKLPDPKSVSLRSEIQIISGPITEDIKNSDGLVTFHEQEHAIFLISFGETAARSSYLERCILGIRRKGEFHGPIAVLTDAPEERYQGLFDKNVVLLRPDESDTKVEFHFAVVKYKRFKTLLLDYIDKVPAFANVKWVYYMDLDILMAAPFANLIYGLEETYDYQGAGDSDKSTLYFFRSCSKNYYANSGFFIMNRPTSQHCLSLWQNHIESNTGRVMDQYSLNEIFKEIKHGEHPACELHVMEHEHYLSFPKANTTMKEMMENPDGYTNLIHPFNSVAETLDPDIYENFVADVLGLTEEEKRETNLAKKAVIKPSKEFIHPLE